MLKSRWLWSADGLASRSRYTLQHRNPGNVSPDNPAAPEVPVTGIRATTQRRIRNALKPKGAGKGSEARKAKTFLNCCIDNNSADDRIVGRGEQATQQTRKPKMHYIKKLADGTTLWYSGEIEVHNGRKFDVTYWVIKSGNEIIRKWRPTRREMLTGQVS